MNSDHIQLNNLLYSCVDKTMRSNEQIVPEHSMGYIIAGEMRMQTPEGVIVLKEGTIGIIRRNQLARTVKVPPPGGDFKSINILMTRDFLRRYCAENKIEPSAKYTGQPMVGLSPDPFIEGYFQSLMPYFELKAPAPGNLAEIKTREAVELILRHDPSLHDFLFDFSEPHKIDLEAYMNRNFMFNISTLEFARLTGRSLAGFKRDFEKIFKTPPGQWLRQKRLAEAWYLIREKGRKPSDVYLDVGFENLSHFSFAFKKTFGMAPSMV
jgi:AraC-like DNA-binding protein